MALLSMEQLDILLELNQQIINSKTWIESRELKDKRKRLYKKFTEEGEKNNEKNIL
jgi:uncharacterized coiled-coil protein SlyX